MVQRQPEPDSAIQRIPSPYPSPDICRRTDCGVRNIARLDQSAVVPRGVHRFGVPFPMVTLASINIVVIRFGSTRISIRLDGSVGDQAERYHG